MRKKQIKQALAKLNEHNQDQWLPYEDDIIAHVVPRLWAWVHSKDRKEAMHAFTAGLERQIAYLVEEAVRLERKRKRK